MLGIHSTTKFVAEHKVFHHAVTVTLFNKVGLIGSGKQRTKDRIAPPIFSKLL